MFACSYGAAFGAIQHMPRIVPGLEDVRGLARPAQQQIVSGVQTFQEVGGLIGRVMLALLAVHIVSRRALLRAFQVPGLFVLPLVFLLAPANGVAFAQWGMFAVRISDGRAVQLLGELPAARVPDLPAWNRGGLGREHRRPDDRHVGGTGDDQLANVMPGAARR